MLFNNSKRMVREMNFIFRSLMVVILATGIGLIIAGLRARASKNSDKSNNEDYGDLDEESHEDFKEERNNQLLETMVDRGENKIKKLEARCVELMDLKHKLEEYLKKAREEN